MQKGKHTIQPVHIGVLLLVLIFCLSYKQGFDIWNGAMFLVACGMFYIGTKMLKEQKLHFHYQKQVVAVLENSISDVFIMFSADFSAEKYTVEYVSPNCASVLGISVEEIQKDLRNIRKTEVHGKTEFSEEKMDRLMLDGSISFVCEHIHPETGECRWYREKIYRHRIDGAEKFVLVLSDRTQEVQNRQQLEQALAVAESATEAKSTFLSNLSHDIRTPMNAILGFSNLLEQNMEDREKVREYIRKLTASGQQLLELLNDMLDISKIDGGKMTLQMEEFQIQQLLTEANGPLASQVKAKRHEFCIDVEEGIARETLKGDVVRIRQILFNLLSNAVKYTPDGGKIAFRIFQRKERNGKFAHLRFEVEDTGIGISPEYQDIIFDAFSREYNTTLSGIQGAGLGLAITKSLVDLMGGTVDVISKPGKGTLFTVDLDLLVVDIQKGQEECLKEKERILLDDVLSGMHILAAEDNELNAEILLELLQMEGATCDVAENGQIALEKFKISPAGYYDLIFMDIQMPVMDGYMAARAIRACEHPSAQTIPIAAMTANTFSEDIYKTMEAGMNAHIAKPVDMEIVKKTVAQIMNGNMAFGEERLI